MSVIVTGSSILLASVSYVEPVVQTSYLDIQVVAEVTMPDVLTVDIITPVDSIKLSAEKKLFDFQDTTDSYLFSVGKVLSEYPMMQDAISFGDIQPHKGASDNFGTIDGVSSISLSKLLIDSLTTFDHITANKLYQREFSDDIAESDVFSSIFDSGVTTDTTVTTDSSVRNSGKGISEGINLIDNMDGDLTYAVVKVVGELLSSSDSTIVAFSSTKADNVSTSSSGILSIQNYSDITYFLEDYVGISREFT